jgi:AraC-like DNA-binding protein
VWVFAPGEYHCGDVGDDQRWDYRGIYLDSDGLEALGRVFANENDAEMWLQPGLHQDRQLARLIVQAHRCIENGASLLERQARWWAAMGLLFGRYGQPRPRFEPTKRERSKMQRVRDYLAENHTRNVSVDELAAMSGLSRYHLMRAFTREYGMPPHAYANQLRLTAARRLLAAGKPLSDAATAAGFYDQSHLTRLFKRAYGVTPGVYAGLREHCSDAARNTLHAGG